MENLFKTALKTVAVCLALTFVSCAGDRPTPPEPPVVDSRIDSLETVLNRQIAAVQALLGGQMSVSTCSLQADGSYKVNFEDGTNVVALVQEGAYSQALSIVEEAGVTYWAALDKEGEATVLEDASQNKVTLESAVEVVLKNDRFVISVAGTDFETAYTIDDTIQMFGFGVHKDSVGAVYAVTFTFADQVTRTLGVMGYPAASFCVPGSSETVTNYFLAAGSAVSVELKADSGVEFTLNATEGWTAVKRTSDGKTYIDITAADDASKGTLEVIIGGDVVLASLELSSQPFRDLFASSVNAVVNTYAGVAKFAYGICDASSFDEASVKTAAEGLLSGTVASAQGQSVSEADVCVSLSALYGSELATDTEYVLWAVPAQYAGDQVNAGNVFKTSFKKMVSSIEVVGQPGFIDADITVSVKEADALFGGLALSSETLNEEILYQINNSIYDSLTVSSKAYSYTGKASSFSVSVDQSPADIMPDTEYVLWVAPAVSGNYEYTLEDVLIKKFTTAKVVSGGSLEVTYGTPEVSASSAKVTLASESASMIYYTCLHKTTEGGLSLSQATDQEQFEAILASKKCVAVKASSVAAEFSGLEPENDYYVYAAAVDADGKHGVIEPLKVTTQKLVYNDIKLTIDEVEVKATTATIRVSSDGDLSDYIYWFGPYKDPFWQNDCKLLESSASKFMALNSGDERIAKAMRKYGEIAADGTLSFSDLAIESQYVFVILEKDDQGNFSKAKYRMVTTLSADLGEIVREGSDRWNAAKATVKLDWITQQFEQGAQNMMSRYAFDFSCPTDMTAYVLCGSDTYFSLDQYSKIEDVMIEIEDYTSRRYDDGTTPSVPGGGLAQEPSYYKNGEYKEGQLMNVYKFYVHGVPTMGCVTYFAKDSHGEDNCDSWEKGVCSNYQHALDALARQNSLEPYQIRASQFGLTGTEYDNWVAALYEAYQVYYKDAKPLLYVNDGSPIRITQAAATGINEKGEIPDRVIVMFKDLDGNYFEPMYFEVPNYFE